MEALENFGVVGEVEFRAGNDVIHLPHGAVILPGHDLGESGLKVAEKILA